MKLYKNKVFILLILLVLLNFIIIPIVCSIDSLIINCFGEKNAVYNIKTYSNMLVLYFTNFRIFIFSTITSFIVIWFTSNIFFTIKKTKIENKGVKFKAEDGTFGTAAWMNGEELTESFDVGTRNGLIVGKTNDEIITLPDRAMQNRNVAVFGASR